MIDNKAENSSLIREWLLFSSLNDKIGISCEDSLKVVTCFINMYAYGVFTNGKMVKWENGDPTAQWWEATTAYFNKIWTDMITFSQGREESAPLRAL